MRWAIAISLFALLCFEGSKILADPLTSLEERSIERLDKTSDWLVKYGHYLLEHRDADFLKSKLFDEGLAQLWVTPLIGENDRLAVFRVKDGGYNYDIEVIHRAEIGGHLLEYWTTHVSSRDYVTSVEKCTFTIAEVNPDGKRSVLTSSPMFIESFPVLDDANFDLPDDDLRTLYSLKAWQYAQCFPNSSLPETEIYIDGTGAFRTAPAGTLSKE